MRREFRRRATSPSPPGLRLAPAKLRSTHRPKRCNHRPKNAILGWETFAIAHHCPSVHGPPRVQTASNIAPRFSASVGGITNSAICAGIAGKAPAPPPTPSAAGRRSSGLPSRPRSQRKRCGCLCWQRRLVTPKGGLDHPRQHRPDIEEILEAGVEHAERRHRLKFLRDHGLGQIGA